MTDITTIKRRRWLKREDGLWVDVLPPKDEGELWWFYLDKRKYSQNASKSFCRAFAKDCDIVVAQCWLNNFLTLPVDELRALTAGADT